jgi:hypothetical protein
VEEVSHLPASPCATTSSKVNGNKSPSIDEYRNKVISIVQLFENALVTRIPNNEGIGPGIRIYIWNKLKVQISMIISVANKDVEKRYKYYVTHWQRAVSDEISPASQMMSSK